MRGTLGAFLGKFDPVALAQLAGSAPRMCIRGIRDGDACRSNSTFDCPQAGVAQPLMREVERYGLSQPNRVLTRVCWWGPRTPN